MRDHSSVGILWRSWHLDRIACTLSLKYSRNFSKSHFASPFPRFLSCSKKIIDNEIHTRERKKIWKKKINRQQSPSNFLVYRLSPPHSRFPFAFTHITTLTLAPLPSRPNLPQRPAAGEQGNRPDNAHGAQGLEEVPLGVVHEEDTLERDQRGEEERMGDGCRAKSFREMVKIGTEDREPL